MIRIFYGDKEQAHEDFQLWRRTHVDGFHMTESSGGLFTIHWTQDKRENPSGRGCHHQGGSDNEYGTDRGHCYTTARKVCSENLGDLVAWAKEQKVQTKNCRHCDTRKFPFPGMSRGQ